MAIENHSSMCCPARLEMSVCWCSTKQAYRVVHYWTHPDQLWVDEVTPVVTIEAGTIDDVLRAVRLVVGEHQEQLKGSRRAAHSVRAWRRRL